MSGSRIPLQHEVDLNDPEERNLWVLVHLPNVGGVAMAAHPEVLRGWSKHLDDAGYIHVDRLRELADENGMIHVDQLPVQKIKYQPPYRGPQTIYNTAGRWVPIDTPDPEPVRIQDLSKFTRDEREAYVWQLKQLGDLPPQQPDVDTASVEE